MFGIKPDMLVDMFKKRGPEKASAPIIPANALDCDQLAQMLESNPETMKAFEDAYRKHAINEKTSDENLFDTSSREVSQQVRTFKEEAPLSPKDIAESKEICARIVDALVKNTPVIDGTTRFKALPRSEAADVAVKDIKALPERIRPQLTDQMYTTSIAEPSFPIVLANMKAAIDAKDPKVSDTYHKLFRQGLDILDLDPVTYNMLGKNPNAMSNWLPSIKNAAEKHGFFKIPKTKIAKVPLPILQMSRLDYGSLSLATLKIVDDWAMKAFDLDVNKSYFIKTGTYSSKFDFRNAKVSGEKEVRELGEYLLFIQNQATLMAGPLSTPSIYGASTTNEWVVREFIEDKEFNPTIYKGLPLHTEYRVFVDFDTNKVLGSAQYWDPDMMLRRFSKDINHSVHSMHDYTVYQAHKGTLTHRYYENVRNVCDKMADILPDCQGMRGQWSVDVMQNGDDFWLIDMATADSSALNGVIPLGKMRCYPVNWYPDVEAIEETIKAPALPRRADLPAAFEYLEEDENRFRNKDTPEAEPSEDEPSV